MLDVEAVDEFLVVLVVIDHREDGGGVEDQHGACGDGDDDLDSLVWDVWPGHDQDEQNRHPQADDQQHRSAHVGTVQRFDALLHV